MFCVCVRLRNSGIERDINYVKQRDREIDLKRERNCTCAGEKERENLFGV